MSGVRSQVTVVIIIIIIIIVTKCQNLLVESLLSTRLPRLVYGYLWFFFVSLQLYSIKCSGMLLIQQSLFRCQLYYVNPKTGASLPRNLKFQGNYAVLYSTIQYYTQYNTVHCITVQCCKVQCSAVHCSVKHSVLQCIPFQFSEAITAVRKNLELLWNAVLCLVLAWQA